MLYSFLPSTLSSSNPLFSPSLTTLSPITFPSFNAFFLQSFTFTLLPSMCILRYIEKHLSFSLTFLRCCTLISLQCFTLSVFQHSHPSILYVNPPSFIAYPDASERSTAAFLQHSFNAIPKQAFNPVLFIILECFVFTLLSSVL